MIANSEKAGITPLAVRGNFYSYAPPLSRLWLAPTDTQNGRLKVCEIFKLDLKQTGLVVLSACQTQMGVVSNGDEIIGINRGFLLQSPTVIATL